MVERRCHFRIECADDKWATAFVRLRTDAGTPVWISRSRVTYNEGLHLGGGRSETVTASELATTLGEDKRVWAKSS